MGKKAQKKQARHQKRYQKLLRQQKRADAGLRSESLRRQREQSQSPAPRAGREGFRLLEQFDGYAGLRNGLRHIAGERDDSWCGIPMPIEDLPIIIEKTYPNAQKLMDIVPFKEARGLSQWPEGSKLRNTFWSTRYRANVALVETPDGRVHMGFYLGFNAITMQVKTMMASAAWGIEQEHNALNTLGRLIRHHQMKSYLLTGMFMERSKRSNLSYLFRKLRPTLVLDAMGTGDTTRVLCALCLHPIGYYYESWAGAMCATDDVIAHLMMMRADEPMLWRRSNQIPVDHPNAGM